MSRQFTKEKIQIIQIVIMMYDDIVVYLIHTEDCA